MKLRPSRRSLAIALGVVLVLGVIGLLATPPIARAKARKAAEAQHLDVTIGSVRPGFFTVTLKDVRVAPVGESGITATFPEVRASLSAGLSLRRVEVHGGEVRLEGPLEDLEKKLSRWREARPKPTHEAEKKGPEREVVVDGLALTWGSPATGHDLRVRGASVVVDGERLEVRAESIEAKAAEGELVVSGATVELDGQRRLKRVESTKVLVAVVGKTAKPETPAAAVGAVPEPPPLPVVPPQKPAKGSKPLPKAAPVEAGPFVPLVPFPDLEALRAKVGLVTRTIAEKLPEGSEVRLPQATFEMRGATPFSVGPGAFTLLRGKESVVLAFRSTGEGSGSTPLSVELVSPTGAGEPSLTLAGGPIPLSVLGLREGALGLVETSRAMLSAKGRVALDAAGKSATFDGDVKLSDASIKQPKLSRETLRKVTVGLSGKGLLTSQALRVDDGRLEVGTTHVGLRGTLEQDTSHLVASFSFDLPTVSCQDLAQSVPEGLMPTVRAMRFAGAFGGRGRIAFDTKNLDALDLDYTIDDRCRATEVPSTLSRERFTTAFTHTITHPDGTLGEARTGPGSGNWTELGGISPYMPVAVLTTEDGSFFRHHGFNHTAIKQSVVANVKARKFVRGASTITMQLAKNLFLVREKTLSRKLEEIVLADYLEQIFRKDDLIELYLNVVEFGPDVYGITQAAAHYFGRTPLELTLSECLFLSSVLPSPVRSHHLAEHGELPEHWGKHLQALMRIAERTRRISPGELEEGLAETVVFHKAGTPRPPPRAPRKIRGDRDGDPEPEDDWHRLD